MHLTCDVTPNLSVISEHRPGCLFLIVGPVRSDVANTDAPFAALRARTRLPSFVRHLGRDNCYRGGAVQGHSGARQDCWVFGDAAQKLMASPEIFRQHRW